MPAVNKSLPPKPPVKRTTGSVLAGAIPVGDIGEDFIKMCIYGKNRTGKTTLACEFPKPLLLISFEPAKTGGAKSVKKVPGVTYLKITSSKQAFQLAEELVGNTEFKTHVLDTVTSYQDLILQEVIGKPVPEQLNWGIISQDDYRDRSSKTKEGLRPFLNLDCHTILLAQEKDHNPPKDGPKDRNKLVRGMQDESFFSADLGGATVAWLRDASDYIVQLYITKEIRRWTDKVPALGKNPDGSIKMKEIEYEEETGKLVRRLRTMYHPNYDSGMRSEDPSVVPEYIEAHSPKEMYDKVMKVIRGIKLESGGK